MLNIKIFIGKFLECKFISYLFLLLNYKKNLKFHNTLLNVEFIDSVNFVRIFFGYFEKSANNYSLITIFKSNNKKNYFKKLGDLK